MVRSKLIAESQKQEMSHQASAQQDVQLTAHAKRRYHRNKKEKDGHTCQSRRGSKYETEPCRGRKDGNEQKQQKGIQGGKTRNLLAVGDRLGKKRQMHRFSCFFGNNCIVFKVQEFMYKKYSCVGLSTPKETKRTEERHKLWGGEGTKNSEQGERI